VSNPDAVWTPYLCVKLVAEPARIWLWIVHREQVRGRRDALERTARRLPEEEATLRKALSLDRRLPRSPDPPLGEAIPFLARMSARLARCLEKESGNGADVRLVGGDDTGAETFPLVDSRTLTEPERRLDEAFVLVDGDLRDPQTLASAATADASAVYPALKTDALLVFPSADLWGHAVLRAVQSAATDPVSFAVTEGRAVARFTDLPGWSASDSARRAVAEHRGWLTFVAPRAAPSLMTLGVLLRAVRAALFYESLDAGEPKLPLTMAAITRCLADAQPSARGVAEEAYASYRACRDEGRDPDPKTVAALHSLASALPVYASRR
jgi:hypothetical protein